METERKTAEEWVNEDGLTIYSYGSWPRSLPKDALLTKKEFIRLHPRGFTLISIENWNRLQAGDFAFA